MTPTRECPGCRGPLDPAAGRRHPTCGPVAVAGPVELVDSLRLLAARLGGQPIPAPPGMAGPCARCETTTHRYGDGGSPLCHLCQEAA